MKYIEHKYKELKEAVNFKNDLDWQKDHYASLNINLIPSYNTQEYDLMNKAAGIILEIDDYLSRSNSSMFRDEEFELIDKLKNACNHYTTKEQREDAFKNLEESVNYRMQYIV
jgi:hypothetical protein